MECERSIVGSKLREGATGCLTAGTLILLVLGGVVGQFFGLIWNPYFICVFVTLAFLNGLLVGYLRRPRTLVIVLCSFFAILLSTRLIESAPTLPFWRFYYSIQNGMSKDEVIDCLHRAFPENGRYKRPIPRWLEDDLLKLNLDFDDGRYNAEVVTVEFEDNRVVSKDYSPD
jgi:hypothetical protein